MKIRMLLALGAAVCVALPALAQNDGALAPGPKPAIKTSKDAPIAQPVPGKTSFTADQAADHMTKRGYTLTSIPLKGDNGIWYAEGAKTNSKTVMVMMDYQGNVFEGEEYSGHPSSAPGVEPTNPPPVKPVAPSQK